MGRPPGKVIGLTGGIASGKSTVAGFLQKKGARIVDADRIAHEILAPGGAAYNPTLDIFGQTIASPDGSIDKSRLAGMIFADPKARASLESITHPLIFDEVRRRSNALAASGETVIVEAALLIETRAKEQKLLPLHAMIVVLADPQEQVRRLVGGRGMDAQEARARIAAQTSNVIRESEADYVIRNEGSIEDLSRAVDLVWEQLGIDTA